MDPPWHLKERGLVEQEKEEEMAGNGEADADFSSSGSASRICDLPLTVGSKTYWKQSMQLKRLDSQKQIHLL